MAKSDISPAAKAEIDRRRAVLRPVALEELVKVIQHREGAVTQTQLEMVAALLARTTPAEGLVSGMLLWTNRARTRSQPVAEFYTSEAWSQIIAHAEAFDRGEPDRRPNPAVEELRAEFQIDDDMHVTLGLEALVSTRLKAVIARSKQGAKTGAPGRPRRASRPWEEEGVSEATWRKRQARAKATEHKARVGALAQEGAVSRIFVSTREARPDGNPATADVVSIHLSNRLEFAVHRSAPLTYFPATRDPGNTPPPRPTPTARPDQGGVTGLPEAWVRTAACRRLAVVARGLGLVADEFAALSVVPGAWWTLPNSASPLSEADQADLDAATADAAASIAARNAIEVARSRKQSQPRAVNLMKLDNVEADPHRRPAKISEELWEATLPGHRPHAALLTGRFFLYGWDPDDAFYHHAMVLRRTEALIAAVLTERPDAEPGLVAGLALERWAMATREAVPAVLARVDQELAARPVRAAADQSERDHVRAEIERARDLPYIDADFREEIIAEAIDTVIRSRKDRGVRIYDAVAWAVESARERQRKERRL